MLRSPASRVAALLGSALLAALLLDGAVALGFTPGQAKWAQLPVRYQVDANSSRELGAEATLQLIAASYNSWAAPECSAFSAMFVRTVNGGRQDASDRINTHVWLYNAWPAELGGRSVIGVTSSVWSGRSLIDADIQYNGVHHRWTSQPTSFGQVDAQSIMTHEIGHQLGLNHSPDTSATMYFSYPGGTSQRSLAQDDIAGVCFLYPRVQGECDTNNDCGSGQACVSGTCIDPPDRDGSFGDPCSVAGDCQSNLCVRAEAGTPFCSSPCTQTSQCPTGFICRALQSGGGACAPGESMPGTKQLGESCTSGQECAEGLCIGDPNAPSGTCSRACSTSDDVQTCPDTYYCGPLASGSEACILIDPVTGDADVGEPCARAADCRTGLCVGDPGTGEGTCALPCTPGVGTECAEGERCAQLTTGGGACVPDVPPKLKVGEPCEADSECDSGQCGIPADGSGGGRCSEPCTTDVDCRFGYSCQPLARGGNGCLQSPTVADGGPEPMTPDGGGIDLGPVLPDGGTGGPDMLMNPVGGGAVGGCAIAAGAAGSGLGSALAQGLPLGLALALLGLFGFFRRRG